jgi:hypothetical protein
MCGEASRTGVCYVENGRMIVAEKALVRLVVTFFDK